MHSINKISLSRFVEYIILIYHSYDDKFQEINQSVSIVVI